jgi:hypothetical protein
LALTETVGANERINRHSLLCQSPGVLQRCGWRLNALHRDVVAQRVQDGVHVARDAGTEQLHEPGIAAQLGDLILEGTTDDRRRICHPTVQPVGGLSDVSADVDIFDDARFRHHCDGRPLFDRWSPIHRCQPLSSGDNTSTHLRRLTTVSPTRLTPIVIAILDRNLGQKERRQWDSPSPTFRMLIRTHS